MRGKRSPEHRQEYARGSSGFAENAFKSRVLGHELTHICEVHGLSMVWCIGCAIVHSNNRR